MGVDEATKREASSVARLISQHFTQTDDHAEAVDELIRHNGDVSCIYCGELTLHGLTVTQDGHWESSAKETMTNHMLTCAKRPEKRLLDIIDVLGAALLQTRTLLSTLKHRNECDPGSLDVAIKLTAEKVDAALKAAPQPEGTEER